MNPRLILARASLLTVAIGAPACDSGHVADSEGFSASDMALTLKVEEDDLGASVVARFDALGDDAPILRLSGGDHVTVTGDDGDLGALTEEWTEAEWPRYRAPVQLRDEGGEVVITLDVGGVSRAARIAYPPAFELTSPQPGTAVQNGEDVTVDWAASPFDDDRFSVRYRGDCVRDQQFIIFPRGSSVGPFEREGSASSCEVSIEVNRSLEAGDVDGPFEGRSFRADRRRSAPITVHMP